MTRCCRRQEERSARRAMALELEWVAEHRDELMENWNLRSQLKAPKSNRTAEVAPAIRHTVPWRVTSVIALPDSRLRVTFVDGVTGDVDMRSFLSNPRIDSTIFEPLRNPAVFAQAQVVLGVIQWPNGADLAPDAMYDAIREYSVWVLD